MASSAPFGLILPSRPVLVEPQAISQTQYAFSFPASPSFSHFALFLHPGSTLPEGTLASVYIQQSPGSTFIFLGAIGTTKQSAIFKLNTTSVNQPTNGIVESGLDANSQSQGSNVTIGISIESVAAVSDQLQQLGASKTAAAHSGSQSLILPANAAPSTKLLAQRIIKNAFNFLASFAGSVGPGGQEVIPLKSFQDWWTKFERRIENDPGFLERDD